MTRPRVLVNWTLGFMLIAVLSFTGYEYFVQNAKPINKPNDIEVIDFGLIHAFRTPRLQKTISYKNRGNRTIQLVGTAVSCGCSVVTVDKSKLEPDESVDLKVEAELPFVLSHQSLLVTLLTDDDIAPERKIQMRFVSIPRIHAEKPNLDLGTSVADSPNTLAADFRVQRFYLDDEEIDVRLASTSSDKELVVEVEKCNPTLPNFDTNVSEWSVRVRLTDAGSKRIGRRDERIELRLDTGEFIQIPVRWEILSSLTIHPRVISFGACKVMSDPLKKTILIKSLSDLHPRIVAIDSDPFVSVITNEPEGKVRTCDVVLDPSKSKVQGPQSGVIQFRFEDGKSIECEWFASIERE